MAQSATYSKFINELKNKVNYLKAVNEQYAQALEVPAGADIDPDVYAFKILTGIHNLDITSFDSIKENDEIVRSLYHQLPTGAKVPEVQGADFDNDGDVDADDVAAAQSDVETKQSAVDAAKQAVAEAAETEDTEDDVEAQTELDAAEAELSAAKDKLQEVTETFGEIEPVEGETKPETVKVESDAWSYVHDAESFNASYADGALAKYYAKYPDEDLESTSGNANATFNDRIYVGTLDESSEAVSFKAGWEETSQKITNVADPNESYYMARLNANNEQYAAFQGASWTLYTDAALTEEAGHTFNITGIEFDGFEHTYNAAANAPGSTMPWVVVNFEGDTKHTVEFEYDGVALPAQWEQPINWGIVSVVNNLGINEFDASKLKMYIS